MKILPRLKISPFRFFYAIIHIFSKYCNELPTTHFNSLQVSSNHSVGEIILNSTNDSTPAEDNSIPLASDWFEMVWFQPFKCEAKVAGHFWERSLPLYF